MTQFQLFLLAVFMLLVSNSMSEYAMSTTEVHSHYDTPQSPINNKHKKMPHSHEIQRHSLGTQARVMDSEQRNRRNNAQVQSEEETPQAKTLTLEKESGNHGDGTKEYKDTKNKEESSLTSHTDQEPSDGKQVTPPKKVNSKEADKKPETTPKESGAKGEQEKGTKTSTDQDPKKVDSHPAPDALATERTTVEPAAEGDHTEGSSDPTSTTTHSPTGTVQGADSQAAVKAGALFFILSIGIVLAVFM